jgi:hypothetical protein
MIYFIVFAYLFVGLGVFAMTNKIDDEVPMHLIAVALYWPILIFVRVLGFIFTGRRGF